MKIFIIIGFSLILSACASLPENYSEISADQLIRGIASNNKPKIMPSNYSFTVENNIEMYSANYNVVGSYTSGMVLDPIKEAEKYCLEKRLAPINKKSEEGRHFLFCGSVASIFIAFHYVSTEIAGRNTGHTYAYFDHVAFFNVNKKTSQSDIESIANKIIKFEKSTVDHEYVLDYQSLKVDKIVSILKGYVG
jgi:hypothetical protein